MTAGLKLEITTPTGQVYSKEVDMVTLPGQEGEMGILPMHVPLIALLGDGEIIARRGNEEDRVLVTGGCAEITAERVAILTVFATDEAAIDEKKAEDARARAEARLKEKISPEEVALVQASLTHSLAQLKFKRRRHHPSPALATPIAAPLFQACVLRSDRDIAPPIWNLKLHNCHSGRRLGRGLKRIRSKRSGAPGAWWSSA